MKRAKVEQLVHEAMARIRMEEPPPTFFTVNVVTGMNEGEGPEMFAFPFQTSDLRHGSVTVDLPSIGYRAEKPR